MIALLLSIAAPMIQYATNMMLARWTQTGAKLEYDETLMAYIGVATVYALVQFLRGVSEPAIATNACYMKCVTTVQLMSSPLSL